MTSTRITVSIQRLPGHDDLELPAYQTSHAAGMDLCAAVSESIELKPGAITLIPCGFAMALPDGYDAQVRPRSGLAVKHGITLINSPGTIDADYRGEVKVPLINHGREPFTVTRGMRIAQMIFAPVTHAMWQAVDDLPGTMRGVGGFGHTGH